MHKWKTAMMLTSGGGCWKTGVIFIKRGIFQGDSLYSLLFCMTLIPFFDKITKDIQVEFGMENATVEIRQGKVMQGKNIHKVPAKLDQSKQMNSTNILWWKEKLV